MSIGCYITGKMYKIICITDSKILIHYIMYNINYYVRVCEHAYMHEMCVCVRACVCVNYHNS